MAQLKLMALDDEDLAVISSCCQDAVLSVGELDYVPEERRFILALSRYAWEEDGESGSRGERHKSVLQFAKVNRVQVQGIDRSASHMILSLLAILFDPGEAPGGVVELVFAGDGAIRLEVECIEVQLSDMQAAWEASSRPTHSLE